MQWELATTKNPNINLNNVIGFKDSLFIYIGSLWWLPTTPATYDVGSIHDYKYDDDGMEFLEP